MTSDEPVMMPDPITLTPEQVAALFAAVPPPDLVAYVEEHDADAVDVLDLIPWVIARHATNLAACAEMAVDLQDRVKSSREEIRRWRAWATRLVATLAVLPPPQPYSRAMVDSVMRDVPMEVSG